MSKRIEDFPIEENILNKYIDINEQQWDEVDSEKYVYVNFSMVRMQTAWIVPKLIFAKGMEKKHHAKGVVITWNKNEKLTRFIHSFKMEHLVIEDLNKKNLKGLIKALMVALKVYIKGGAGEKIKEISLDGRNVGLNLYEDILRTSSLSTLRTVRNKIAIKKIIHLIWSYDSLKIYCQKKRIVAAVTDDMAYHEGMFIKLFSSLGAEIRQCNNYLTTKVTFDEKDCINRFPVFLRKNLENEISSITDEDILWSDEYLKNRFAGKNGRAIDRGAYKGKRGVDSEEFIQMLKLDPSKKTVVIMAHTFTDAVFNYGTYYFRDYYDWIEQTLEIAAENTSVNWILKPHPSRGIYKESEDSIESLYERKKTSNIFWLPDHISAEVIKDIADVLVTVGGNAGIEFSCVGIPSVIIGKPVYYGWGFTIEPKTLEDYKKTLLHIQSIKPLEEEQIILAKKILYMQNRYGYYGKLTYHDEFSDMVNDAYQNMIDQMAQQYFMSNDGTDAFNSQILELITDYMRNNKLKETLYYKKGLGYE